LALSIPGGALASANLGKILALLGFGLLLLSNLGRRRSGKWRQVSRSQLWSSIAAFALILAGLLLWGQK
jgi:hypothetical protein